MFRFMNYSMQPYMDEADDFGGGSDTSDGFDDVVIEEPTETTTEPVEDTKPTEPVEEVKENPKVKLKYNHEEKEYSLDEVVPLAQKGMNYDKIQNDLQSLKGSPVFAYVEKIAKANNMTADQVVDAWQKADEQAEINALAQRENVPYEIAERLYKNEQKTNQLEQMFNTDRQTKAQQEKQNKEYEEFFREYKDIDPKSIPMEVVQYRNETGKSLTDSYRWYENKSLKERIQKLEQNEKNKSRNPVGPTSKYGTNDSVDPVMIGFDD